MKKRKIGISLNILSSIALITLFEYGVITEFSIYLIIILLSLAIIFFTTYFVSIIASGSWKFIHKKTAEMDERELNQNKDIIQLSYSIFSIFVLASLLMIFLLSYSLSMPIIAFYIYLAHIIPSAIAGWKINHLK